jgi:hypothetical protein
MNTLLYIAVADPIEIPKGKVFPIGSRYTVVSSTTRSMPPVVVTLPDTDP